MRQPILLPALFFAYAADILLLFSTIVAINQYAE
jgi:hypothetical protein